MENRIFVYIEIFTNITRSQKDEFWGLPPELALLSASILLEYFYTEIRFSTPGSAPSVNQLIHGVDHAGSHTRTHARSSSCFLTGVLTSTPVLN